MKIAYFSPLPPRRSGIADYGRDLLPALVKRAEVDLWVDQRVTVEELPRCRIFDYVRQPSLRRELRQYDAVIYHMGNSPAHRNIYPVLLADEGLVVLHDFVLHHFLAGFYLEALRLPALYVEEMSYNYGEAGAELARTALKEKRLLWEHEQAPARFPLNKRVLDHARAVIVHSDFARRLVRQSHPHLPIAKVNLPVTIAGAPADRHELRRRYGIPADRVVIGSFGSGSPAKRIELVMRAIARLGRGDILYLLVGEMGADFARQSRSMGLGGLLRATGHVEWKVFNDYCNLIDLGIDLRFPTMGESSAGVCRILGAGKACIVSNLGWFAELPDDCAVKISAQADEEMLARCLSELIADGRRRDRIGENARSYIREHHSAERAAADYLDFVRNVQAAERGGGVERALVEETGKSMAEIGIGDQDAWLIDPTAGAIASLFKSR